jgi:hypothetical protein
MELQPQAIMKPCGALFIQSGVTANNHRMTMIQRSLVFTLIMLIWSSLALCGEIHDAARKGE